ncbi:uncharacterized protein LOC141853351 [Brevipalpus obovatus]|uniref:uncharacterized protein LOC141853351 n=1 Tax=Brevipalpus obovatus TaxID=246614 RepID=UPI003D9DC6F1
MGTACPVDVELESTMPPADDQIDRMPSSSQSSTHLNKVLVKNIGYKKGFAMASFVEFYEKFFEDNFGPVNKFYVIRDVVKRYAKGYGFVIFKDSSSMEKLLQATKKQLTIDLGPLHSDIKRSSKRCLEVLPAREALMKRVQSYVRNREECKDEASRERERIVSERMSKKIKIESIAKEEDQHTCEIHKLSDDDIHKIFGELKSSKDLYSCELVCRRWNIIAQDIWSFKQELNFFSTFSYRSGSNEKVFQILKKCPRLKKLDLNGSLEVDKVTLDIVGQCCPMLEIIDLGGTDLTDISLQDFALQYPKLKGIYLNRCYNMNEDDLHGLLKIATKLECLGICGENDISGECFHLLSQLRELKFSGCQGIPAKIFAKLSEKCHSSLERFEAEGISLGVLSVVCRSFPNLKTLWLDELRKEVTSHSFDHISKLEKLEELYIGSKLLGIDDKKFINLLKSCPRLKVLRLIRSINLTDASISEISNFCKDIRLIDLSQSKITSRSFDSLSRLEHLEGLSLTGTNITEKDVEKLLEACPELMCLNVNRCRRVSPRAFLVAYDLSEKGLLDKRFSMVCCYGKIQLNSMESREKLHDICGRMQYSDYDESSSDNESSWETCNESYGESSSESRW